MSFTDSELAATAEPISALATRLVAALAPDLAVGEAHDGHDLAAPLVPEGPSSAVSANLVGPEGQWAGRVVIAMLDSTGAPLVEGTEPAAGLADALTASLAALDPVAGDLLADQLVVADAAAALAGIRRDGDPDPVIVPLTDGTNHVGTVAVLLASHASAAAEMPPLPDAPPVVDRPSRSIATLGEVALSVTVELGRTELPLRALLGLHPGAVIQLDRAVSAPVDIYANGTRIGRGEMVVVDTDYGVRITELVEGD